MPYKDKDKQREYQRKWKQRRRQQWLAEHGPCVKCGSEDDLQVDHIDPKQKASHRVWSWTKQRREAELSKCQVLCEKCHIKKTTAAIPIPLHGTNSRYTNKKRPCRCFACKKAHRKVNSLYRKPVQHGVLAQSG